MSKVFLSSRAIRETILISLLETDNLFWILKSSNVPPGVPVGVDVCVELFYHKSSSIMPPINMQVLHINFLVIGL